MASFDENSRYVLPELETYNAVDHRGRVVQVLPVPEPPLENAAGRHVRREGQTLGQLADGYLRDPHAYWRICEVNGAILPDALKERETIDIPDPIRF